MTVLFHRSYRALDTTKWFGGHAYRKKHAHPGSVDVENLCPLLALGNFSPVVEVENLCPIVVLANSSPVVELENFEAPLTPTNIIAQG